MGFKYVIVRKIEGGIQMEELKTTFYDDVGICHEFILLDDDVWKKDEIFINFSVRVLRMIALEVGVPVEYVGYGKWGGRLTWGDESNNTIKQWVNKIESHGTYKGLKEVCKLPTWRKDGSKEQENIFEFLDCIPVLKVNCNLKEMKKWAKKDLTKEEYKKFLRGCSI